MRNLDIRPGAKLSQRNQPALSFAEDLTGFALWLASPLVTLLATLVRAWRYNREIRHSPDEPSSECPLGLCRLVRQS
jgi:hypothetical protein